MEHGRKTKLIALACLLAMLGLAATTGNLEWTQFRTDNRHGDGLKGQAFTGSEPATNDCAKFDANHNLVGAGAGCATGTVTSIATTSPITGGTITSTGTIACATCVTSAASLTANLPVFGSGGQATAVGTRTGNTTAVATSTGSLTSGNCAKWDANGNIVDAGTACGGTQLHSIPFGADGGGSVLSTGDLHVYPTADFACTITRIDVSGYPSGSITIDVWKAAGAIPTSGNKISASAPLTLSSSQLAQNGSLTGWTTSVSVGDVFGFSIATVTTVQVVTGQIWCQ